MNSFINFILFSVFIFLSYIIVDLSKVRIQRRVGLSSQPFKLTINIFPSYLKNLPIILLLFISTQITHIGMLSGKQFVFLPLFLILLTKLSIRSNRYTDGITTAACFLSILISTSVSLILDVKESLILKNPFFFLSFILSLITISILNQDREESPALNIARTLALNSYMTFIFMPQLPAHTNLLLSTAFLYLQFLINQASPTLNLFQKMRQSLTLIFTCSFVSFMGNLIWVIIIGGGK